MEFPQAMFSPLLPSHPASLKVAAKSLPHGVWEKSLQLAIAAAFDSDERTSALSIGKGGSPRRARAQSSRQRMAKNCSGGDDVDEPSPLHVPSGAKNVAQGVPLCREGATSRLTS